MPLGTKTYSKRTRTIVDAPRTSSPQAQPTAQLKRRRSNSPDDAGSPEHEEERVFKKKKTFGSVFKAAARPATTRTAQMRQLVLASSSSAAVVTCGLCGLSYTRGAADDEALHKSHCSRIRAGTEWTRQDEDEAFKLPQVMAVDSMVELSSSERGKIISLPATIHGRLGTKLNAVVSMVNLALSAPPLTPEALRASRVYLFLLPMPKSTKSRVVGCVIARAIEYAFKVIELDEHQPDSSDRRLRVDHGVYCDTSPLPTPLGISRVFVAKECRRKGIAKSLLDAATRTFVHGCVLSPANGQVAFSQPTGDGQSLMEAWGEGHVRIFEE